MTVVLDASAILAFLQDEKGADLVEVQLAADARRSLAHRLKAPTLTADAAWGDEEPVRQIR